ncbi:MAG: SPOR domain-containing protein [Pseudomonadota bacterium]
MEGIVKTLVETNIATIIAISGIALLFLSFAGKFGTYIEIKADRQNMATVAGVGLLLLGVGLHAYPRLTTADAATGPGSETETNPIIGEVDPPTDESGPSIDASTDTTPTVERRFFIQAGSFSFEDSAQAVRSELVENGVVAFVAPSETFEFLCPGLYVVLVTAPSDQQGMRELLTQVKEVAPDAFPRLRSSQAVDLSRCPS